MPRPCLPELDPDRGAHSSGNAEAQRVQVVETHRERAMRPYRRGLSSEGRF